MMKEDLIESTCSARDSQDTDHLINATIGVLRSNVSREEKIKDLLDFIEICEWIDFDDARSAKRIEDLFDAILEFGSVPTILEGNDRELDENDFRGFSDSSSASFSCIERILLNCKNLRQMKIVMPCLLLCAQHAKSELWTSLTSVAKCESCLQTLFERTKTKDFTDLMNSSGEFRENLLRLFRKSIIPRLTRDNWKCNPGYKSAFIWCLSQLKHPHVEFVLNEVLPPSLLFVDDFVLANRLHGMKCLYHIMDNTPAAEVERHNRAQVIYDALKNLVYTRESKIVVAVYPCLLKVLKIIEKDPRKPAPIRDTNRYDRLLETVLNEMESEQIIALRTAYSEVLPSLIYVLGITAVKQMKSTIKVILQYLEVYGDPEEITRRNCLHALSTLVSVAWPRIPGHMSDILKGLLRLLYDIHKHSGISDETKDAVVQDCIKCLKMLRSIDEHSFDDMCRPLLELTSEIPALLPMKIVLGVT